MLQIHFHRVVHSVIKFIEQTQGTNLPSALRTILSSKPKCDFTGDINMEAQYSKNTQILYLLKFSTTKSEITLTGSTGPRPANHRGFCLLRIELYLAL